MLRTNYTVVCVTYSDAVSTFLKASIADGNDVNWNKVL